MVSHTYKLQMNDVDVSIKTCPTADLIAFVMFDDIASKQQLALEGQIQHYSIHIICKHMTI